LFPELHGAGVAFCSTSASIDRDLRRLGPLLGHYGRRSEGARYENGQGSHQQWGPARDGRILFV